MAGHTRVLLFVWLWHHVGTKMGCDGDATLRKRSLNALHGNLDARRYAQVGTGQHQESSDLMRRAIGHDHPPLRTRELLDVVAIVGDEDVTIAVYGDAVGPIELPIPVTQAPPLGDEDPVVREPLADSPH